MNAYGFLTACKTRLRLPRNFTITTLYDRVCLLLSFQLLCFLSLANDSSRISHLGIEQGLSNNSVTSIYQDRKGFMWFGTYDGLNRFDGYGFTVFRNILEDSNSLPHNYIYDIHEDAAYRLWIATGQGIGIYDPISSSFHSAYYINHANGRRYRIATNVNRITTDKEGTTYIGTNGLGLMVQAKSADASIQLPVSYKGRTTTDYSVTAIKADKQDNIWLFIDPLGLCVYDKKTKQIRLVYGQLSRMSCIDIDPYGNIWLGGTTGLYRYTLSDSSLQLIYSDKNDNNIAGAISGLYYASDNKIWLGTVGRGIIVYDPSKNTSQHLPSVADSRNVSSENISAVFEDQDKRKWVGTLKGGINIYSPAPSVFYTIAHNPFNKNSLVNDFVSTFMQSDDHTVWIGTDGGGLSIWDRSLNKFTNYSHEAGRPGSLSNNQVSSIIKDHLGNIWIATFGGGINKYNGSGSFQHFPCIDDSTGVETQRAWVLYEDRQQTLWATTFGKGYLYVLNRQKNRFEVFSRELWDILSFYQDDEGILWGGNFHELIRIDRNSKQHIRYEMGKPVRAIYKDKSSRFWIGLEGGGLVEFDPSSGKIIRRFSVKDGLSNNAVLNILEDNAGNLWMSTFNGLSRFDVKDNQFRNYFQEDGLQSNQFLYGAAKRLNTGELLFGGIRGFNILSPHPVAEHKDASPLRITDMRINNLPLAALSRYIEKTDSGRITSISMPFKDAVLSVDFAALEYSFPGKIFYAYYLEGWDKDWNYVGKVRNANYTRLEEGDYILHIRSTNPDGVWSERELTLHITVFPPWYRSWWAYIFYALVVVGAIIMYQRYRVYKARLKYEIALSQATLSREKAEREKAEAEIKTQLAEREMEKVKAEKEQEINDRRLTFFTNISHEFRAPIGLIVNPVKSLLQSPDAKSKVKTELETVYRNARRLISLVDQLLLFRKAEAGADRLRVVSLDICSLANEVLLAFDQQARAANIEYSFERPAEAVEIYADREKLEIVLYNLISNALKYTPAGGKIVVRVTTSENLVNVMVSDTGYGIPADIGEKLFDRFYQVRKKDTPVKPGFGIGLFLVKHFIEGMKGRVWYKSEEGAGTRFYIELQKGKAHFDEEDIVEEFTPSPTLLNELVEEASIKNEPIAAPVEKTKLQSLLDEKASMLVVDDDGQMRDYLARIFADKFTVYLADNATEGLKLASQYVPDIIISDVNMDGMNGVQFCAAIREDSSLSHIPVILLTGNATNETRLEGLEGGADDYIVKPFDQEILQARVANILKSRTTLQKYFYNEITLGKTTYKVAPEYRRFLDNCIAIVEANLDDPEFSIKVLATELRMGQSSLYKKVKSISGQSPSAFIRFIRLRKVAKLLVETDYNINEAAFEAGFNDMKHFREQFFRLFGMKPSEYVKSFRKGHGDNA